MQAEVSKDLGDHLGLIDYRNDNDAHAAVAAATVKKVGGEDAPHGLCPGEALRWTPFFGQSVGVVKVEPSCDRRVELCCGSEWTCIRETWSRRISPGCRGLWKVSH